MAGKLVAQHAQVYSLSEHKKWRTILTVTQGGYKHERMGRLPRGISRFLLVRSMDSFMLEGSPHPMRTTGVKTRAEAKHVADPICRGVLRNHEQEKRHEARKERTFHCGSLGKVNWARMFAKASLRSGKLQNVYRPRLSENRFSLCWL